MTSQNVSVNAEKLSSYELHDEMTEIKVSLNIYTHQEALDGSLREKLLCLLTL